MGAQYFRFTGYGVPTSFRIRSPNPLDKLPKPVVGFQSRIPHTIVREQNIRDYKGQDRLASLLEQPSDPALLRFSVITFDIVRYNALKRIQLGLVSHHARYSWSESF